MAPVRVRYIVKDVVSATEFYTKFLGFKVEWQPVSHDPISHPDAVFAGLSRGDLRLLLTSPDSPILATAEGNNAEPGGWNRISLPVEDLEAEVESLRKSGVVFRHEILTGPGGRQIVLEDPFGNPIELFEWNQTLQPPGSQ